MPDLHVVTVEQQDNRLGRQVVHDPRSRGFATRATVDRSLWRDKEIRLYDPWPNPNQPVGCCTGVSKAEQFNAVGSRVMGRVLTMSDALRCYARNTEIDPWEGTFVYDPETGRWSGEDTGSSGLASAKTAQEFGWGGEYRWLFGGADEVVQNIMEGRTVSAGTWWYWDMFDASGGTYGGAPIVKPTGGQAGGHQYLLRGYAQSRDLVEGRCWWGEDFRDFWVARADLHDLLMDDGDAHVQVTA